MSEGRIWLIILTRSRENSILGSAEKVKTLIWEEKKNLLFVGWEPTAYSR